ncbi:MAG: hypothetical protein RJB65_742, partial [Actinomycetota bacterium]
MAVAQSTPPTAVTRPTTPQRPIVIRRIERDDVIVGCGSALSSYALVWFLFERLLGVEGQLGFWVSWYVVFLALSSGLTWQIRDRVRAKDQIARTVVWSAGLLVIAALGMVVLYTISRGYHALRPSFFVEDQRY